MPRASRIRDPSPSGATSRNTDIVTPTRPDPSNRTEVSSARATVHSISAGMPMTLICWPNEAPTSSSAGGSALQPACIGNQFGHSVMSRAVAATSATGRSRVTSVDAARSNSASSSGDVTGRSCRTASGPAFW